MAHLIPDISVVYDKSANLDAVATPLASVFSVKTQPLADHVGPDAIEAGLYVYYVNPRPAATYELLHEALEDRDRARIFVLPTYNSDSIASLERLGISDHLVMPASPEELRRLVKKVLNGLVEKSWATLEPAKRQAFASGLKCFENCFEQLKQGKPLPIEEIAESCSHIREAAALGGLNDWIDALDRHHNYSFRHSMFVCGSLTYFAHSLGIRGADLEFLTVGGLLHDIGKSRVSNAILDKAGKLDDAEWEAMKKHPEYSRTILLNEQNLDKIVVTMAASHHEKLDGTGYPDGLSGGKIDDYVRLTTIADVYSALIDKRAYKGSMSSEEALDLMATFEGHLDPDLLRSFRAFVLDQDHARPAMPEKYVA
jgi:putative nucleotidyltransferase with HDIG domain